MLGVTGIEWSQFKEALKIGNPSLSDIEINDLVEKVADDYQTTRLRYLLYNAVLNGSLSIIVNENGIEFANIS